MATIHDSKQAPKGWEGLPEFPLPSEVMGSQDIRLLMRTERGISQSRQSYLEDQYTVMRHEAIEPMRLAIREYKGSTTASGPKHAFIHTRVSELLFPHP